MHSASMVIDGHNDLPWEIRNRSGGDFTKLDLSQPQPKIHTDIPRLRAGGVGAQRTFSGLRPFGPHPPSIGGT
ncbi:MAG: membrane dipeptidase [Pirellulaceae bacterium]